MKDSRSDRRQFLIGSSGWLLAGASALAAQAALQSEPKVRVAVVGTGARGSDLIRSLTTIEAVELVAICDDYPPHLEQAVRYAGPDVPTYARYEDLLRQTRPDAVIVATPLYLHYEMCMQALEAGCAVFCEKTMCHSVEQARELAAVVESKNAVFQVGLQRRANAIYRQAMAMIETGMLGRITAIKAQWHRNNNWRRPVPVARDHTRYQELEHRLNWRLYWPFSQGLMAELASHQMDVANWALGAIPRRVLGSGGIDYWRDGREVFDNVFCIYEYELPLPEQEAASASSLPNTYTVRVTYSSLQNNAYEGAAELIEGTRGTLFLTQQKGLFYREQGVDDPGWSTDGRVEQDASLITSGKTLKMTNDPWAHRGKPFEIDSTSDDTRDELVAFINCVQRRDPQTICTAQVGLENTLTVLAGNRAMREGGLAEV